MQVTYYQAMITTADKQTVYGEQYDSKAAAKEEASSMFLTTLDAIECGYVELPSIPGLDDASETKLRAYSTMRSAQ